MKQSNEPKTENSEKNKDWFHLYRWQIIAALMMVYDAVFVNLSYFFVLWLRFDCRISLIDQKYKDAFIKFAPIYAGLSVIVLLFFRLYRSVWRFASFSELIRVILASFTASVLHTVLITLLYCRMPISYYVFGSCVQFMFLLAIRFGYRLIRVELRRCKNEADEKHIMLIGAGSAGKMIIQDVNHLHRRNDVIVCLIDDDPNKWGRYIDGVPVVGGRDDILLNVQKYKIDKIYLAIPSATMEQRRDILDICKETCCELKNLPGIDQYIKGNVTQSSLKEVRIEDLLGRAPIVVNMESIYRFIQGKVILVTGGGGSIGSELCRQIAQHHPKLLIVFDIYENNAHAIQLELRDKYPELNLEVLIGSVRDSRRLKQVFEMYRPDVVYHAAAHKHVPLMEDSPCESIKNNAVGTYKTAYFAMVYGCKRFVLISTDKAVNPTNIMGASKRLCEMVIQTFDRKIKDGRVSDLPLLHVHSDDEDGSMRFNFASDFKPVTEFVAVRFGNVLGSNGSVIPRFKEQIAKGGPVTVTHPDIIRYFMTIPEAASLVLQAGTYAQGGEIFVLDMGSPVKIDTLARNMIKMSGLKPDEDIKIIYTGLRPGEKLYEEKLMAEEGMRTTPNKLIHIGSPIPFDTDLFLEQIQMLMDAAYDGREDDIRFLVMSVVDTYHPAGEHGSERKDAEYERQIEIVFSSENEKVMTTV